MRCRRTWGKLLTSTWGTLLAKLTYLAFNGCQYNLKFPNTSQSIEINEFKHKKLQSKTLELFIWCRGTESNCRHGDFQAK